MSERGLTAPEPGDKDEVVTDVASVAIVAGEGAMSLMLAAGPKAGDVVGVMSTVPLKEPAELDAANG